MQINTENATVTVQLHQIEKDVCNVAVYHAPNAENYIDMVYNEGVGIWEFPSQTKH